MESFAPKLSIAAERCGPVTTMTFEEELAAATDAILASTATHKLIVAGPGTGKTTIFKRLLGHGGAKHDRLVLTFINNLKNDLDSSLGDLADVYTFHGYCHHLLRSSAALRGGLSDAFLYFPPLVFIVKRDWEITRGGRAPAFIGHMRKLTEDKALQFFGERSDYYDAVGFDDSVYRVYSRLRSGAVLPDKFGLMLIDEFQDFNRLESSFIDMLGAESQTVIVGDDDQALYSQLKGASHDFIRSLYNGGRYERFALPFCMRCPRAIVEAVAAIVARASDLGSLQGRIDKPFRFYPPRKGADSERYPTIKRVRTSDQPAQANDFGRYIARAVDRIPNGEITESWKEAFPTVLVIGAAHYLRQIGHHLRENGYQLDATPRERWRVTRRDGLRILKKSPESNLGWRIVLELDKPSGAEAIIRTSIESGRPLPELVDRDFKRAILQEGAAFADAPADTIGAPEPDKNKPLVKLTSFEGSKGLSAQHVFIVGMHDGDCPRNPKRIDDIDICRFIVALTRTRKECHLLHAEHSSGKPKSPSTFLGWLPAGICEDVAVDAAYWND